MHHVLIYIFFCLQAAGRHQCSYLISLQKQEFRLQGGNHNWLKGLNHIPTKLRNLYDINKILAHRPWLLNRSHIEVNMIYIYYYLHFLSLIIEREIRTLLVRGLTSHVLF